VRENEENGKNAWRDLFERRSLQTSLKNFLKNYFFRIHTNIRYSHGMLES
jgi:hypothetical protein